MAHRHELKRQRFDTERDAALHSEEGRLAYWDGLYHLGNRYSWIELLGTALPLPGAVIECGVYRGASLFMMCREIARLSAAKRIFACDSFEGFPPENIGPQDRALFRSQRKLRAKFKLANDIPERIHRFSRYFHVPVEVEPGFFAKTLPTLAEQEFCFIHLDVDVYASYRECLEMLFPKLQPGGLVVFDEYDSPKWPGARKAIDEYFADRPEAVTKSTLREIPAWYVRKQPT